MLRLGKEVKKVEGVEAMTELCKCGWIVTARSCDKFTLRQIVDDKGSVFCGFGKGVAGDVVGLTLGYRERAISWESADLMGVLGGICIFEHKEVHSDGTVSTILWDMARVEAIQPETEVTQ